MTKRAEAWDYLLSNVVDCGEYITHHAADLIPVKGSDCLVAEDGVTITVHVGPTPTGIPTVEARVEHVVLPRRYRR